MPDVVTTFTTPGPCACCGACEFLIPSSNLFSFTGAERNFEDFDVFSTLAIAEEALARSGDCHVYKQFLEGSTGDSSQTVSSSFSRSDTAFVASINGSVAAANVGSAQAIYNYAFVLRGLTAGQSIPLSAMISGSFEAVNSSLVGVNIRVGLLRIGSGATCAVEAYSHFSYGGLSGPGTAEATYENGVQTSTSLPASFVVPDDGDYCVMVCLDAGAGSSGDYEGAPSSASGSFTASIDFGLPNKISCPMVAAFSDDGGNSYIECVP